MLTLTNYTPIIPMKKVFRLFVFLLVITTSLTAQKVYFVYLQTDSQQPFYARLGEKIYNSTPAGYRRWEPADRRRQLALVQGTLTERIESLRVEGCPGLREGPRAGALPRRLSDV